MSGHYHSSGGIVSIAEDETIARDQANKIEGCKLKPEELPTYVAEIEASERKVFMFPDAGCC